MKLLQTLSWSSICFSIAFRVNSFITSYLLFVTLFITGIRKSNEKVRAQDAVINKYKNILMFSSLESLDSFTIASVDDFNAMSTLFKQFFMMKNTVGYESTISDKFKVDSLYPLTTNSIIASQIENK